MPKKITSTYKSKKILMDFQENEEMDWTESPLQKQAVPKKVSKKNSINQALSMEILSVLGGKENIISIDSCITRLRLEVKDIKIVDEIELKKLGAAGVLKFGQNGIQAIFGSKAKFIATAIQNL